MQVWKIDEDGFYTFKTYEVEKPNEFEITTPCKTCEEDDFYKPKWTGEKWIEGWTEEEIEKWKEDDKIDNCSEPTTEERVLKLEEEKSILAENVYQLASILEIMLGGTESGQTETTTTDTAN